MWTLLGYLVDALRGPVLAVVRQTLLGPFTLPAPVAAAWSVSRDVGFALLTAALLYAVLHAQLGRVLGADVARPWEAVPRLALAALGVAGSQPLVRGLLAGANALTATVVRALPAGPGALLRPLTTGMALSAVPLALGIGSDVVALLLLAGVAALACFYILRGAEIVLLALLLPIAAALWIVPGAAGVWRALLGELIVAIFVQPAQAFVLMVFATGLAPAGESPGAWLWGLAALVLLFRVRALLAAAVGRAGAWSAPPPVVGGRAAAQGSAAVAGRIAGLFVRLPEG